MVYSLSLDYFAFSRMLWILDCQYMHCAWILSSTISILRLIHVPVCMTGPFLLLSRTPLHANTPTCFCSSVDGHLDRLQVLACSHEADVDIHIQALCGHVLSFSPVQIPRCEVALSYCCVSVYIFKKLPNCSPRWLLIADRRTSNIEEFWLVYIMANTWFGELFKF